MFCSESLFLCQWAQGYSPLSCQSGSMYLVLCWSFWSIRSWVSCRVLSMDLYGIYYIQPSCLTNTIVEDNLFCPVWVYDIFSKNHVSRGMWVYVWDFNFIPFDWSFNCWWNYKLVQSLWKSVWWFLRKMRLDLPQDLALSLLSIFPQDTSPYHRDTWLTMFIDALLIATKSWKQLRCIPTYRSIEKMWYIYSVEYYLVI